jgi:hypothetical protein
MKRGEERRAYWSALVARFEASGLSRRVFAAEAGVGLPIFQYWLYKFRREGKGRAAGKAVVPAIRLVPVTVKAAPVSVRKLEVMVGAVRIRVPVGADPSYVATLAEALRGRGVC